MSLRRAIVVVAILALGLFASNAQAAPGQVFYSDGFETYDVGTIPPLWNDLVESTGDAVTDEWAASGEQSFVSATPEGRPVRHPFVSLEDIGAWPAPVSLGYEGTLRIESTEGSSGAIGFFFVDPRDNTTILLRNSVLFEADGEIVWRGIDDAKIGEWTPGTETIATVEVAINTSVNTAHVWIDGVLFGSDLDACPMVIPASVFGTEVHLDMFGFTLAAPLPDDIGRVFLDDVSVFEFVIPARVRIAPRTLNLKSHGRFITCFIELPEGFTSRDIDRSTIQITTDNSEPVFAPSRPTAFSDGDEDGLPTLMVKFPRAAVQALLAPGRSVTVTVSGELEDGTPFSGDDHIRVIRPGKGPKGAGGSGHGDKGNGGKGNGGGKGHGRGKKG